ncbi:hypothetical protein H9Q74_007618 [Fusarium xylarioides]|nr:hypothetical protein H9Q71_013133 [Fusarium xylarioides]KAG5822307.1 hypothetical protein H9Q74_007618 [Fusarium xylarioides]
MTNKMAPDLDRICKLIEGRIYSHVDGFYDVFFRDMPWYKNLESLIEPASPDIVQPLSSGGSIVSLERLNTHLHSFKENEHRLYYSPTGSHQAPKTSFWLAEDRGGGSDELEWSEVMMIGDMEDKDNPQSYQQSLANLISLAEQVFEARPTRQFLHGINIRGSAAEPWLFDRMGLYSGRPFDISKEGARLVALLAGYSKMSYAELGMDTLIRQDHGKKYIRLSNNKSERLILEQKPFVAPKTMLGKGVTCYKARAEGSESWEAVVKFCWKSEKEEEEVKILRLIKERKVWGVIQLLDEGNIQSLARIHQGLTLGTPRRLFATSKGDSTADMSLVDSQTINGHSELLLSHNSTSDESRMLSYTVISPHGRHITEYRSINEFLVVLRDAIKAHRSLYTAGRILHRDISINNIIITEAKSSDESRGTLIDLDAAIDMTAEKPSRKTITGTKPFMAIGLLQGEENGYRHDIESFFYVLLFSATIDRKVGLPANTPLQKWMGGTWAYLANRKADDLADPKFDEILAGFQPDFKELKGLARALRDMILGREKVSTEDDGSQMYDQIIEAFDKTIAEQSKGKAQI